MNPEEVAAELFNLSVFEQQLICRITPIYVHMLKHGGGVLLPTTVLLFLLPKYSQNYPKINIIKTR